MPLPADVASYEKVAAFLGIELVAPGPANDLPGRQGVAGRATTAPASGSIPPTMEQLARHYLTHLGDRAHTRAIHEACLRDHILPQFGRFRLDEMAYADTASWLASLESMDGQGPVMAGRVRALLAYMFKLARRWNLPGSATPLLARHMWSGKARSAKLTSEDLVRLREAAAASHNPCLGTIVALLVETRLRVEELLTAHWEQIDLAGPTWTIYRPDGTLDRMSFSPGVASILRQIERTDGCPYVIANPRTGKPFRSITRSWEAARQKAGLVHLSLYELQHLCH